MDTGEQAGYEQAMLDEMTESSWFEMCRMLNPDIKYEDMNLSWLEFNEYTRRKQLH